MFRETRFRKATREYRDYVERGWGLDTWRAWPFIEAEFGERERELHVDALGSVHFFQNMCVGALVVAGACVATAVDDPVFGRGDSVVPGMWWVSLLAAAGCGALAYVLYRQAVTSVELWGENKIVSALMHRGDVYRHLGLRQPVSFEDEHVIAKAANTWLKSNVTWNPSPRLRASDARLQLREETTDD